ncbi:Uma2 family endonuclease [Dyadobacter sp. CY323]|uniref:Uma2 family endonuclease n=1 Tax=Dyadobacter sp. CY323 TaxID=2907302 RepID=UPI001F19E9AA|nr:Uma2 family endonuclease [Dyadobacter sp. CY323]MCE6990482.1 Uma2 family endonuclease [Dyadobacter sp. CY323]
MNGILNFERDARQNIILLAPIGCLTANNNLKISMQIGLWNCETELGVAFASTTGFTLPNGSVRSPVVSWIRNDRWEMLSEDETERFAPICPDFLIEIRSNASELKYLRDKMEEYILNGTQLAWLIDRFDKNVYIYRTGKPVEIHDRLEVLLSGESVLPGFTLDLGAVIK